MNKVTGFKNSVLENKIVIAIWFFGLAILAIIPSVFAVLHAPIDPDSSYYLSVVERMNEGLVPYVDFPLQYTPVVFYLMLFFKQVFSIGINYEFFLTIHFILQFFCALLVYKISLLLINRKDYSFYAALLFILASHWNGGNAFLMETPSLFFGLLAIYLAFKPSIKLIVYIFIGILVSMSFLSKQYGLGFLGLLIYMLFYNDKKWKQLSYLLLGFILPILICVLIWGNGLYSLISGGYGVQRTFLEGFYSILGRALYFFIRIYPVLIVGVLYLPSILKNAEKHEIKSITMLIFGIFGFMLQFYFAPFSHYYLYIIPFASILSFVMLTRISKYKWFFSASLIVTILLSVYSTYSNRVYKIYYINHDIKENQYRLAKQILSRVDINKTLYVADIGLMSQYYLTNLLPPNLKTLGYALGMGVTEPVYLKQIKAADYVLKFKKEYPDFNLNSPAVKFELKKRKIIGIDNEIILYK